jgi:hypothetical protein
LRLGDKFQDFWHGQPPKKESIGSHKRPGAAGHGGEMCKGTACSLASSGKTCCAQV